MNKRQVQYKINVSTMERVTQQENNSLKIFSITGRPNKLCFESKKHHNLVIVRCLFKNLIHQLSVFHQLGVQKPSQASQSFA